MRRVLLRRRRRRNRLTKAYEQIAVRILAMVWLVRKLLRHARAATR